MSVASTAYCPPSTIGLPKSVMLSMNPTRNALAMPGLQSGSVTVLNVVFGFARSVCAASSSDGRHALDDTAQHEERDRREREHLRQPHPWTPYEPASGRQSECVLEELIDESGAAEQQDQAEADDERRGDDRQQREELQPRAAVRLARFRSTLGEQRRASGPSIVDRPRWRRRGTSCSRRRRSACS
jgi:hypothetical protein